MMDKENLEFVMKKCIDLAKDCEKNNQYPIAAVIADQSGKILSMSKSSLREKNDRTNHPEMEAIRMASEILQSRFLKEYYLFTTLEPCPMCTAAAIWAKMKGIVYGACQEDILEYINSHPSRTFTWRQIWVKSKDIICHGYPQLELYEGVCREECKKLFV